MKRLAATLTVCVVSAIGSSTPHAMTYVATDFPTLVGEARAIAVGRVVSLAPQWKEGRRGIETLLTLEVDQYLKGDLGQFVTLAVPGGEMGRYRSVMPGAPSFVEGEELVLFLAGDGAGMPHVLGLGQGVFRIMTDRARGARIVVPEILMAVGSGTVRIVRGDRTRRPSTLEQFAAEVRGAMQPRVAR
jgi:hypothetical protein